MSSVYPDISKYKNGQRLDQETMNKPITELADRTDWLKDRLDSIATDKGMAGVRLPDAEVESGTNGAVSDFDVVYLDANTGLFSKALSEVVVESNPFQISAGRSLAVGIALSVHVSAGDANRMVGSIALSGLVEFESKSVVQSMLQSGETFRNGPYYLSSSEPGKLTADPKGPAVYVGMFMSREYSADYHTYAILAPCVKDLAEMHMHRAFALGANCQSGIPDNVGTGLLLLVGGTYTGTREGMYCVSVDMIVSGSTSSYTHDIPAGTAWDNERFYARWIDFVSGASGYSKIEWESDTKYASFKIGDHGLVGYFAHMQGTDLKFGTGQINAVGHQFGRYQSATISFVATQEQSSTTFSDGIEVSVSNDTFIRIGKISKPNNDDIGSIFLSAVPFSDNEDVSVSDGTTAETWKVSLEGANAPAFTTRSIRGWRVISSEEKSADSSLVDWDYIYEPGLDPDLNKFYPPSPVAGCALMYNGVEMPEFTLFGDTAVYRVLNTGILWRSDNAGGINPFGAGVGITFYTSHGKLPTSSFVTSIKPAEGSGVKIREEGTSKPASTGNLVIDAQIPVEYSDPALAGYSVPKQVEGNKLLFGPVVSSIKAGAGLVASSKAGQPTGYGDVTISLDNGFAGGSFDEIVLHNAKQELIETFPYVKLLAADAVASAFTMKAHIPVLTADAEYGYKFVFCMSVFGLEDVVALADDSAAAAFVSVSAKVLHDWYPGMQAGDTGYLSTLKNNLETIPNQAGLVLPITLGGTQLVQYSNGSEEASSLYYRAFDPVIVHNGWSAAWNTPQVFKHDYIELEIGGNGRPLHPNSSVAITVKRATKGGGAANEYTGELGFMNMAWKLVELEAPSVSA